MKNLSAALNTLIDEFDCLLDAPNSIKKIRELILQLAVQGKLVPQDTNDEPASELLKKIKAEKEKLIKEKKIKKEKPLPSIQADEVPYELPKGWEWVRLGDVLSFEYGKGLTKDERSESGKYPVFGSNGIVGYHDSFSTDKSAIIIGRKGSSGALNLSYTPSWTTDVAYYCVPPECLNIEYTFIALKTLKLNELGKGIKPGLNRNEAYILSFPVPPLLEQKCIVSKVDQLMKLCDELEKLQNKAYRENIQLNNSALYSVVSAKDNSEFQKHWEFVSDNFDLLHSVPENIAKLRQTILQLAVQGKLVPQDPNEEPVSELLRKIKAEREKLIKEKKIKKEKPLPQINREEFPYTLPRGWALERMGNLFRFIDYRGKTPPKVESGTRLVTAKNIRMGFLKDDPMEFVTEETYHKWMTRGFPKIGDLLFTTEAPMGNVCVVNLKEPFALAQRSINLQPYSIQNSYYLMYTIMSSNIQKLISDLATGMTATGIKAARLKLIPIPLCPLPEQKRIVTKVNQLMKLCDDLESRLYQSQKDSEMLMQTVLQE